MPKVVWTTENDRKLLLRLVERSAKSYDVVKLSGLFPGATPKAIEERIAKLKREAKVSDGKAVAHTGSKPGPKKKRSLADPNGVVVTGKAAKKNPTFELVIPPLFGMGAIEDDDDDDEKPLWQLKREKPWGLNPGQNQGIELGDSNSSENYPMDDEVKDEHHLIGEDQPMDESQLAHEDQPLDEDQPMDEDAYDEGAYDEEVGT